MVPDPQLGDFVWIAHNQLTNNEAGKLLEADQKQTPEGSGNIMMNEEIGSTKCFV